MVDNQVFVIQYNRQMHEEVAKLEEMRKGNPTPITLVNEDDAKQKMEVLLTRQRR